MPTTRRESSICVSSGLKHDPCLRDVAGSGQRNHKKELLNNKPVFPMSSWASLEGLQLFLGTRYCESVNARLRACNWQRGDQLEVGV